MKYEAMYPDAAATNRDYFSAPCDYDPILRAIGTIAFRVDDNDYQGDSRVLFRGADDRWGLLIFGWGSCSGCDALAGCNSPAEVEALAAQLAHDTRWGTKEEIGAYVCDHDWAGDYGWYSGETRRFVREVAVILGVTLPDGLAADVVE